MDKHYSMWAKTSCPFCKEAMEKLFDKKLSYTVHIMDDKLEQLEKMKKMFNHFTVPIIVVQEREEEKLIGGYTDLVEWLKGDKK
jgi:glutaredoxin